jgi:hypothetical protein
MAFLLSKRTIEVDSHDLKWQFYIFIIGNIATFCKVGDFHSGDYEECCLSGCDTMWVLLELMFRKNILPPP